MLLIYKRTPFSCDFLKVNLTQRSITLILRSQTVEIQDQQMQADGCDL